MKNKGKWLVVAGISLVSVFALTSCSGHSSKNNTTKTFSYVYTSDPSTLDYILTSKATTSDVTTQGIDGLLENDKYGNLIPSLAKTWTVSKDGLTYTYKLRDGIKWYTSDGEEYANVTAQDFVTGLKHAADKKSDSLYIVQDSVKGLQEYIDGKTNDFSTVGVKALDKKTVQYTLKQPESFWNSKLTYGILAPLNAEFLKSKGNDFGKSTDPSSILYNGAFLISALTGKSSIEFTKNKAYWDSKNVHIDNVQLTYYDGQDQESLFRNFDDGAYSVARLFPTTPSYKTAKKKYGKNITYGQLTGTTYYASFNLNRSSYNHTKKTNDQQKRDTREAVLNKNFRQSIMFGFDRQKYQAQNVGQDASKIAIRNTLVPSSFVQIGDKTFDQEVEKQLSSYGDQWKNVKLEDGQDGLYNPQKAKQQLTKAKEELTAKGISFPIHLDLPVNQTDTLGIQQAQSMKQSIEASLGAENVQIDISQLQDDTYQSITYLAETTNVQDWDISTASGWGADYEDPSSYLDIFNPDIPNSQTKNIGITPGQDKDIVKAAGFSDFANLVSDASLIRDNVTKRYEAYAKAQAYLTDSAVYIPTIALGGSPRVSKVVPFTVPFSWSGDKGERVYKYVKLQEKPVTAKQYETAFKEWKKNKIKSNAKYMKSLSDHVEK